MLDKKLEDLESKIRKLVAERASLATELQQLRQEISELNVVSTQKSSINNKIKANNIEEVSENTNNTLLIHNQSEASDKGNTLDEHQIKLKLVNFINHIDQSIDILSKKLQ